MFTIGDFARLGRVSVRMLRHYDAIGVLRPATVDTASGYRFYQADQLRRLNRIIALKDLGFTLQQVQAILDEKVSAEELRGMLRLRRAQLEAQLSADAARLAGVEARLHARGVSPSGPAIAYYQLESGDAVTVHAGVGVTVDAQPGFDFAVVDLPPIGAAATIIHHGPMDEVERSMEILARWIEDNGYTTDGFAREVYLDYDPRKAAEGVTELQLAVTPQPR